MKKLRLHKLVEVSEEEYVQRLVEYNTMDYDECDRIFANTQKRIAKIKEKLPKELKNLVSWDIHQPA